jgi:hypothetical protein
LHRIQEAVIFTPPSLRIAAACVVLSCALAASAHAADPKPGPPLALARAQGEIIVDGNLNDPGWQG